jgi:hypothetical protein
MIWWQNCDLPSNQSSSSSPTIKIVDSNSRLVKNAKTIRNTPRVKQMVVGRGELTRRQVAPTLVCVEPVQLPHEDVLAARKLSHVLLPADRSGGTSITSHATREDQFSANSQRKFLLVMVVNFSAEEIELPKAIVLGVSEISPSSIAT